MTFETFSLEDLKVRDRDAWESLYDALAPDLRSFVQRIGAKDPDDIVGETMLNIVRDIASFKGNVDELRPWAFRIARNRVIDAARRQKSRPQEVALADSDSELPSVTDSLGEIDLSLLTQVLDLLTPEQRETLWLRYAMDFSLETTAEIMGSSPDAVASMAYRALSRLRAS